MPIEPSTTYRELADTCRQYNATLLAVSKTRTEKEVMKLYQQGQRLFGENRAHELVIKASLLPSDIEWHLIGHLQSNKVQPLIPYVSMIQSLDSIKLWQKINQDALEAETNTKCLLQIKIAREESKYGWDINDLEETLSKNEWHVFKNVSITGVMGMATLTSDKSQIRSEFKMLKTYFDKLKVSYFNEHDDFSVISMGMSGDYHIALEEGSNLIRIGSLLFD